MSGTASGPPSPPFGARPERQYGMTEFGMRIGMIASQAGSFVSVEILAAETVSRRLTAVDTLMLADDLEIAAVAAEVDHALLQLLHHEARAGLGVAAQYVERHQARRPDVRSLAVPRFRAAPYVSLVGPTVALSYDGAPIGLVGAQDVLETVAELRRTARAAQAVDGVLETMGGYGPDSKFELFSGGGERLLVHPAEFAGMLYALVHGGDVMPMPPEATPPPPAGPPGPASAAGAAERD